jgi:hypothetical protein
MKNQKIIKICEEKLNQFVGDKITGRLLEKLQSEVQNILNSYIHSEEGLYEKQFPIEFENDLGSWKIESDGNLFFQPKTRQKYIEVNFIVKKDE